MICTFVSPCIGWTLAGYRPVMLDRSAYGDRLIVGDDRPLEGKTPAGWHDTPAAAVDAYSWAGATAAAYSAAGSSVSFGAPGYGGPGVSSPGTPSMPGNPGQPGRPDMPAQPLPPVLGRPEGPTTPPPHPPVLGPPEGPTTPDPWLPTEPTVPCCETPVDPLPPMAPVPLSGSAVFMGGLMVACVVMRWMA